MAELAGAGLAVAGLILALISGLMDRRGLPEGVITSRLVRSGYGDLDLTA